jgi:alkaline phosphatase D
MSLVDPRSNEYPVNKLQSISIIGHTDTNSTRLWIRVYQPGIWTLVWSTIQFQGDLKTLNQKSIADFLEIQNIPAKQQLSHDFTYSSDLTHTFDLTELKSDTVYFYALMSDNDKLERRTELGYDNPLWFRTMALSMSTFNFGFYSCHDPFHANGSFGAWPLFLESLSRNNARFVIGGGDQVYVDCQNKKWFPDIWEWLQNNKDDLIKKYRKLDNSIDTDGIFIYLRDLYRWYYRVYWQFPHLRMVYARFPQYMIWDDHEIMDGWGSRNKSERLNIIARFFENDDPNIDAMLVDQMWRAARTVYFEYAHSHNPQTPIILDDSLSCQWDYGFSHGRIPFYVLDMRGHHDIERDSYRLLGEAQISRFTGWLTRAAKAANTLFVVLPVPIVHWESIAVNGGTLIGGMKDDCKDQWEHETNHGERNILLDLVFATLNNPGQTLVFLSGDVHGAAVFQLRHMQFRQAKVFQVTSSAISRMPAGKLASIGLADSGRMVGNDNVHQDKLFGHTDNKSFAILHVGNDQPPVVDLQWPGGIEGESVIKSIVLS